MGAARTKDLTGQRFGRLTALKRLEEKSGTSYLWLCRCDCGKEIKARASALTSGNTKSCGCAKNEVLRKRAKDITGQRFGLLTVLQPTPERRHGSVIWECRCDCGKTACYTYNELTYAGIESCGCRQHPSVPLNMHYVDGTCVEMLESKRPRKDNTTGHTGVIQTRRGWVARIGFKGKTYYLGTYRDFDLAVKVRELAEEKLHGAFLDWYYATYPKERPEKAAVELAAVS